MAKYYVQSGNFRRVVSADSSRKAAIWAVHEVMQQIIPIESSNSQGESDSHDRRHQPRETHPTPEVDRTPITVLSGKVRVNERGFDRQDAGEIPTMEVVAEWNQMVLTLDRLQRMFGTPAEAKAYAQPSDDTRDFGDGIAA